MFSLVTVVKPLLGINFSENFLRSSDGEEGKRCGRTWDKTLRLNKDLVRSF